MSRTMIIFNSNDQATQRLIGTWENAITLTRSDDGELRQHARTFVVNCVEQVAVEPGAPGEMDDWIANGDLYDDDTPESVAGQWDEMQREARAAVEE